MRGYYLTNKFKYFSLFLIVVVLGGLGEKVSGEKKAFQQEEVKMAQPILVSTSYLPFEMGVKKGLYKAEGLDVEILVVKSGITVPALVAGQVDFVGTIGSVMRSAALGMPVKLIFVLRDESEHSVFARPEIDSMQELKGKRIGVAGIGGSQYLTAKRTIKHFGLDPERDVTFLNTGPDMEHYALFAGSIDATLLTPPRSILAKRKGYKVLARVADVIGKMPFTGLGTTDKKIRENPRQIKKMIKATLKSSRYIKENREEVVTFIIKEFGIDKEMASESYDSVVTTYTNDGGISEKAILQDLQMARETGIKIKENILISQVASFSLLAEVQKELGLRSP